MLSGCMSQGTILDRAGILQKPYQSWTQEECNIVMRGCMSTNFLDNTAPFHICIVPCTPKFLLAYNCSRWKRHLYSTDEFTENTDRQAKNSFGGSFDARTGAFYNSRGQYALDVSQIDSVLILLDVQSATDFKKLSAMLSLNPSNWLMTSLLQDPGIDFQRLQDGLSFRNDQFVLAKPEYVRDSGIPLLEQENEFIAMFHIGRDFKDYLQEHDTANLYFDFGGSTLTVPVSFSF